jgi:hypothetical protein
MATQAQSIANCANAQFSTGPRTAAGKDAVAQNALSHGLSSERFAVLPNEDPAEYRALLASLEAEFAPQTAAESFLVEEMARSQWKLRRIAAIEHQLMSAEGSLTEWFKEDCAKDQVLMKLSRYEANARRAWYKALAELRKFRESKAVLRDRSIDAQLRNLIEGDFDLSPGRTQENYKTNPIAGPPAAPLGRAVPERGAGLLPKLPSQAGRRP